MVTKVDDPVTGTTWFNPNDLGGSAKTIIVGAVGIAFLFTLIGVAQNTIQPMMNQAVNSIPGVNSGGSSQTIRVEG